jgi:hypothetical protein
MHIFSTLCENFFSPIRPTVQKIIGDKLVTDNRQQTADRQTDIFELTPIHKIIFFCLWEGENKWGEIYTTLLGLHGDNNNNNVYFKPLSYTNVLFKLEMNAQQNKIF